MYFVVVICAAVLAFDGHWPPQPIAIMEAGLGSAGVILLFVAFPQLAFKSEERTLTVSQSGFQTVIGQKNASLTWDKICQDRGRRPFHLHHR